VPPLSVLRSTHAQRASQTPRFVAERTRLCGWARKKTMRIASEGPFTIATVPCERIVERRHQTAALGP
jgi:hypothetical protein